MPVFTSATFYTTILAGLLSGKKKEEAPPAPEGWEAWDDRIVPINVTAENWLLKFDSLLLAERYRVSCVMHVKDPGHPMGREFLLFTIIDCYNQPNEEGRVLLLRCERETRFEPKTLLGKIKTSWMRRTPLLSSQPGQRVDTLTPRSMTFATAPEVIASFRGPIVLRYTVFRGVKPTLLEIAAVLEVHSTLSTSYRLSATMNYWFAGSVFETIRVLNDRRPHPPVRPSDQVDETDFAPDYPGYRFLREEESMEGLVDLVRNFEARAKGIMSETSTAAELAEVEQELRQIPDFHVLYQQSKQRRDEVIATLEERERQERARRSEVRTTILEVPDSIMEESVATSNTEVATFVEEVGEAPAMTEKERVKMEKVWAKMEKRQAKLEKKQAKLEKKQAKLEEKQAKREARQHK